MGTQAPGDTLRERADLRLAQPLILVVLHVQQLVSLVGVGVALWPGSGPQRCAGCAG